MGFGCHRTSELSGELPGVHSDFNYVVEKSQERRQGEGSHEECDETELDHCEGEDRQNNETAPSRGSMYLNMTHYASMKIIGKVRIEL